LALESFIGSKRISQTGELNQPVPYVVRRLKNNPLFCFSGMYNVAAFALEKFILTYFKEKCKIYVNMGGMHDYH
jgi:hypothetical protein